MSLKYALTFDYELFGSGLGDVNAHVIEPTNAILNILEQQSIKSTFFVEQLEFDAIMELGVASPEGSVNYQNMSLVKEQIFNIVRLGHDIQLHLHPQWYRAKYDSGKWALNFKWWRFSSLPYNADGKQEPSKVSLLMQGKESLEKLVREVKPDYSCTAFRAGGYNIGTDQEAISALLASNFKLDSSVCPGYLSKQGLSQYDFTSAPLSKTFWLSNKSLCEPQSQTNDMSSSIIELPLLTVQSGILSKISIARLFNAFKNRRFKAIDYEDKSRLKTVSTKALTNTNFDVCLASVAEQQKFKQKIALLGNSGNNIVTLIGHPKDFNVFSPMVRILSKIPTNDFITVSNIVKQAGNV